MTHCNRKEPPILVENGSNSTRKLIRTNSKKYSINEWLSNFTGLQVASFGGTQILEHRANLLKMGRNPEFDSFFVAAHWVEDF